MKTTAEKPICLFCGKPLRKTSQSYEGTPGAPPQDEVNGKKVVEVLRRKKLTYQMDSERVTVWCGEWGGYGDNFFCGLNCGYGWAVMRVEMSEKESLGYVARYREILKKSTQAGKG